MRKKMRWCLLTPSLKQSAFWRTVEAPWTDHSLRTHSWHQVQDSLMVWGGSQQTERSSPRIKIKISIKKYFCVQKNMQPHYKQQQFWMIYKQIFESFLAITLLLAGTETNPSPFWNCEPWRCPTDGPTHCFHRSLQSHRKYNAHVFC